MLNTQIRPGLTLKRPALGSAFAVMQERLRLWHRNHRTRRQLLQLDEQQLADIGRSSRDRAAECKKWFWTK